MRTFFEGTRPGRTVTAGASTFELPVLYFRDDAFGAGFTVDATKLRDLMPSDRLFPVSVARGRSMVVVMAYDYLSTSVGPYGELAVIAPVVYGRRPPRVFPALLESRWPGFGWLVLHLPVTHRTARDGGRDVWGYTKFVSDMEFENTPEHLSCRLEEDGRHILTLRTTKRGIALPDRRPIVTYSVKDGALIRTTIPQVGLVRNALGAGGSSLELGDTHPVAQSLRALDIDLRPVLTRQYLDRSAILREGEIVERDVRPLDGYRGSDRREGVLRDEPPVITLH